MNLGTASRSSRALTTLTLALATLVPALCAGQTASLQPPTTPNPTPAARPRAASGSRSPRPQLRRHQLRPRLRRNPSLRRQL